MVETIRVLMNKTMHDSEVRSHLFPLSGMTSTLPPSPLHQASQVSLQICSAVASSTSLSRGSSALGWFTEVFSPETVAPRRPRSKRRPCRRRIVSPRSGPASLSIGGLLGNGIQSTNLGRSFSSDQRRRKRRNR